MNGGHCGEGEHDPEDGDEHVEGQADAQEHQPLSPLDESSPGREPERLGLGSLVGHEHRERDHAEDQHRSASPFVGDVPGDSGEQDCIGDAVAHRVEERAARAGSAAVAGDRSVEEVGKPREDDANDGQREVSVRDEPRSRDRGEQPHHGQHVG